MADQKFLNIKPTSAAVEFIDLSQKAAKPKIVREGFDVPQVALDKQKVLQIIGALPSTPIADVPRVLVQSIEAGVLVAKGAVVDLTLAPKKKIPFDVFTGLHLDLSAKTLDQIDPLLANATVKKSLLSNETVTTLPAAEAEQLKRAFTESGIGVDDNDPNKTFEKAFQSVRYAMAFQ
jgi:hypothetical protein